MAKKEVKKSKKSDDESNPKAFWASMFLLAIMLISIAGFAFVSSGGQGIDDDGLPSEVPLQEFQDPNSGIIFYGAIRNSEQFIFLNITGYDDRSDLQELGVWLRGVDTINYYVEPGFSNSAVYLFEKMFTAQRITAQRVLDPTCSDNSLLLLVNSSFDGNCKQFYANGNSTYRDSEIVAYQMLLE